MKIFQPKRLREFAKDPPGVTDVTDESPLLTPNVSNVSGGRGVFPEKNIPEPEPQNLGTQHPEPRDTGNSAPIIPTTSATTDPTKPNMPPRPLARLLENLPAVHRQLKEDQAQGFVLESYGLGVPSKLTIRGIQYQALERAVRQAHERTPNAERVIVWTIQPDGWEVTCAQYHDSSKPVIA